MAEEMKKDDLQLNDEKVSDAVADESAKDSKIEKVNVKDEETGEAVSFNIKDTANAQSVDDIKEVNVRANVTSEDYYVAHVNHIFYRRGLIKGAMIFAIVIILDVVLRRFVYGPEYVTAFHYVLVIITTLAVSIGLPFLLKSQIGKAYDKNIFYSKYMRYSINEKRVAIASKSRGKKIPWDTFKYIKQTDDFFLFIIDGTHAVVLPIRVLSGLQIQAIRNFILKNTADNKKIKVKLP